MTETTIAGHSISVRPFPLAPLLLGAGLALAGCSDGGEALPGQARLVPDALDFGPVALGRSATRQVELDNGTDAPLNIRAIDPGAGAFEIEAPDAPIPAGARRALTVRFRPDALGDLSAQAELRTSAGDLTLALAGAGVAPRLEVTPRSVAFDPVVLGTTASQRLSLENVGDVRLELELAPQINLEPCRAGAPGAAFCVTPADPLTLEPGQRAELEVRFTPLDDGVVERAGLEITGCPGCEVEVDLRGRGVAFGMGCGPEELDFGDVNPGRCGTLDVVCENVANQTVVLEEVRRDGSDAFTVELSQATAVSPGESVTLPARFCPGAGGEARATVTLITDQPAPGDAIEIDLSGRGGGPDLAVTPAELDFGLSAVGAPVRRSLLLENRGDRPLVLGAATGLDGAPVEAPGGLGIEPGASARLTVTADPEVGLWEGILRLESNDPDSPLDVPVRGEAEVVAPCSYSVSDRLSFGAGEPHRPAVDWLLFRNRGTSECLITRIAFSAGATAGLHLPRPPELPVRVPGGAYWRTPVEWIATSPGNLQGALELDVSSPTEPHATVSLDGQAGATGFFASPPALDFGALPAACASQTRTVRLWRHASAPAEITQVTVTGDYSIVERPSLPVAPAQGSSVDIVVELSARPMTTAEGELTIQTSLDGQPVVQRVPLIGRSLDAPAVEERFVQLGRGAADLLFVLDFSGGTANERAGLAAQYEAVTRLAQVERLNYQIGVTTSDLDDEGGRVMYPDETTGNIFGRPENRFITPASTPDPATAFSRALVTRSEAGGSAFDESGLGAAYLALTPELLGGHNAGLLRPDAHLGLVILLDEPDQTSRAAQSPSDEDDFYLDYYRAMKGVDGKSAFTAVGLAGDPPGGCNGPNGAAAAAPRIVALAERTGGIFESVCTTDWAATASAISGPAFGERRALFLGQDPDLATLEVRVDGLPLPRASAGQPGWRYDGALRALRFDPTVLPEPDAEIVVRYTPACPGA